MNKKIISFKHILMFRNTRRKTNNPVLILAQNHSRKNGGTLLQEQTIFEPPRRFSDDYQGGDLSGTYLLYVHLKKVNKNRVIEDQ